MEDISKTIIQFRHAHNFTQEQLAAKLHVSQATIALWEKGTKLNSEHYNALKLLISKTHEPDNEIKILKEKVSFLERLCDSTDEIIGMFKEKIERAGLGK